MEWLNELESIQFNPIPGFLFYNWILPKFYHISST